MQDGNKAIPRWVLLSILLHTFLSILYERTWKIVGGVSFVSPCFIWRHEIISSEDMKLFHIHLSKPWYHIIILFEYRSGFPMSLWRCTFREYMEQCRYFKSLLNELLLECLYLEYFKSHYFELWSFSNKRNGFFISQNSLQRMNSFHVVYRGFGKWLLGVEMASFPCRLT